MAPNGKNSTHSNDNEQPKLLNARVTMKHLHLEKLAIAFLIAIAGCITIRNSSDRAPIPKEDDFRSVLLLGDGRGHLGSGFVLIRNGRQYVVTSKHFASYMAGRDTVQLYVNGGWIKSLTRLVGHGKGEIDISVFTFARSTISQAYNQTAIISENG
jgi:hypothetical protein